MKNHLSSILHHSLNIHKQRLCLGSGSYYLLSNKIKEYTSILKTLQFEPQQRLASVPIKSVDSIALMFAVWNCNGIYVPLPELTESFCHRIKPSIIYKDFDFQKISHEFRHQNKHVPSGDPAMILFSSGTTSDPKGIVLSHTSILTNLKNIDFLYKNHISAEDSSFSLLPWYHCYGLVNEVLYLLYKGAHIQLPKSKKVKEMFLEIRSHHPSLLFTVPSMLENVLKIHNKYHWIPTFIKKKILFGNRLRMICVGGSRCSKESIDLMCQQYNIPVFQGYGLTESSPMVSLNSPEFYNPESCGKILNSVELSVLDSQIFLDGDQMMLGYLKECKNNSSIEWTPRQKPFPTGDKGRMDENGFLHVMGRIKNEYKLANGKYIDPVYLESCYITSPFISQIMITSSRDNRFNIAILYTEHNLSIDEIKKEIMDISIRKNIQKYEIPKKIIVLQEAMSLSNNLLSLKLEPIRHKVVEHVFHQLSSL